MLHPSLLLVKWDWAKSTLSVYLNGHLIALHFLMCEEGLCVPCLDDCILAWTVESPEEVGEGIVNGILLSH